MPKPHLILFASLLISAVTANASTQCSVDADCGAGMRCSGCSQQRICTPIRPIDPKTKAKDLPFNRYSWLTTHNSFAFKGDNSVVIAPTNQEDSVTDQLNNGVRGLMLDMYDFENDIWLCHSFQGKCYNITAFQPAINVLKEIQVFLAANPSEVITIFIEDYVTSPNGLTKVFNASGLLQYWFPVAQMPKNGSDWPLLSDMIKKNHRLLVFTSKSKKEASESIAYEWNYVVENQYGDKGLVAGSCPNRAESSSMNSKSKSLVLMNHFPTDPLNITEICIDNSDSLPAMLKTCHDLSANRWPNFIAVDYYKRSNGGGAQEATDIANGHLVCGCDNVAYCKANSTFGTCAIPPAPAPTSATPPTLTPTANLPSNSNVYKNSYASLDGRFSFRNWVIRAVPLTAMLLL